MQRLFLKTLTVSLGYSLAGQGLRMLYPFFSHQVLVLGVLVLLATVSIGCVQWVKTPRTEFYILLFWSVAGFIVGVA